MCPPPGTDADEPVHGAVAADDGVHDDGDDGASDDGVHDDGGRDARDVLISGGAAAVLFLAIQLSLIAKRVPIGHDESVYLMKAREFASGMASADTDGYWAAYRAPGLPFLMSLPTRVFGESISMSRGVVALLGAGCIVATALLAGRLGGRLPGMVAPWLVLLTSAFTGYASLVLLDVPGTFFVLLAALLLERSTRDGVVVWWPLLLVPLACMAAVYMRFGATTNLAAAIAVVIAARADLLIVPARRVANAVRLGVVLVASGVLSFTVLVVPAMTGSRTSPLRLQRLRQEAKDISPWASYGDMADLLWPNGSRPEEAVTWLGLAVLVVGVVLTAVAVARGRYRRLAVAGAVGVVVWTVGLNYALAQLFANYIGLGAPFFALLAAPGWAYAFEAFGARTTSRRVVTAFALAIALVGSYQVLDETSYLVERNERYESLREAGRELRGVAGDRPCGLVTSYVQVAYYGGCSIVNFAIVQVGEYASEAPDRDGVFDLREIDRDQVFLVLVEDGKRQPEGDDLDELLGDAELLFEVPAKHPVTGYRIVDLGDS